MTARTLAGGGGQPQPAGVVREQRADGRRRCWPIPPPVDAAALAPEVERIAALRTELLKQGLQSALAIRAVLTPEQLARAAKKRTRMVELQKEMRELVGEK